MQAEARARLEAQAAALRRAERGEAEAALARQLLAELRVHAQLGDCVHRERVSDASRTRAISRSLLR